MYCNTRNGLVLARISQSQSREPKPFAAGYQDCTVSDKSPREIEQAQQGGMAKCGLEQGRQG